MSTEYHAYQDNKDGEFMGHLTHDSWFGGKTIGMFAGIALLINNITGPGVPSLPNMFAESGWLIPTITFILIWISSSLSTTMYCEAMRKIPGNDHFRDRIEYTSIVDYYFGHRAYMASQIGLNGALQSLNIISVIQSAQVMDNLISAIFTKSCGFNLSPFANSYNGTDLSEATHFISCINTNDLSGGDAWGCHVIITAGFLVALVMTLPMGYYNLDDNMIIQVVAFVLTLGCWAGWFVAYWFADSFSDGTWVVPAVTPQDQPWASQAGVLGTILFNFGFVTTVPSWVNEKKPEVSVNKTVWLSTFLCNVVFFAIGIPGAMAFQKNLAGPATNLCADTGHCYQSIMSLFTSSDIPDALSHGAVNVLLQISVYMFPVVAVLSSIPVFSIVIKYNCIENQFSHKFAFLWGVLFPWVFALPLLYQPDALNQFITFSSLFFVSFTDFVIPWCLYIILQLKEKESTVYGAPDTRDIQASGLSYLNNQDLTEHFALPESWKLTAQTKIYIAGSLVVFMTCAAAAGTVLQIQTSVASAWVCSTVNM